MLKIELYGVLQQVVGATELVVTELAAQSRVEDILARLAQEHPALLPHLKRIACAQGDSLVRRDQTVDASRPLILLPPVSGG